MQARARGKKKAYICGAFLGGGKGKRKSDREGMKLGVKTEREFKFLEKEKKALGEGAETSRKPGPEKRNVRQGPKGVGGRKSRTAKRT